MVSRFYYFVKLLSDKNFTAKTAQLTFPVLHYIFIGRHNLQYAKKRSRRSDSAFIVVLRI